MPMEATKTVKLRIKDKHAKVLSAMAREVNQVWNFCNETRVRGYFWRDRWKRYIWFGGKNRIARTRGA